jgi:hypothetical protein
MRPKRRVIFLSSAPCNDISDVLALSYDECSKIRARYAAKEYAEVLQSDYMLSSVV